MVLTIPMSTNRTATVKVGPGHYTSSDGAWTIRRTIISSECTGGAAVTYWFVIRNSDGETGDCLDTLTAARAELASGIWG